MRAHDIITIKTNFTVDNLLTLVPDLTDYLKTEFNKYGKKIQPDDTGVNEEIKPITVQSNKDIQ
jgi:hypothetical protein